MSVKLFASLLCGYLFLTGGCNSKPGSNQNSTPTNTPPVAGSPSVGTNEAKPEPRTEKATPSSLDACGLIEKSEIESVQGGKVQGMVPSKRDGGALAILQCYYTVFSSDGSKNLSVHLEVTQKDPKSANQNTVGDLWRDKFQAAKGTKKMEKPKPVPGVGDGAYWVGNNKIGALYVLKKDKLVRVSVGGPDSEEMKIQKSRTLAEKVLARLK